MKSSFKTNLLIKKIRDKNIVALPTDTIFGLSCLPTKALVSELFALKNRNKNKGFILLTSNLIYLAKYIDEKYLKILEIEYKNIKNPTTFIVPSQHFLATKNTIAVRLTSDNLIQNICIKLKSAIISTSCNISGGNNIKTLLKLRLFFDNNIFAITPRANNTPSKIINLLTKEVLR